MKLIKENDDIKNSLIKRPTYGNKKQLTNISFSIGDFQMGHYQTM